LHALAAVTDYEPDKKVRNNTIAVWLGQRGASLFALVLFALNLSFSWPLAIYLMLVVFTAGALTDLITPKYAKQAMTITIMWGVVTTLTYFIERILL
jgi:1,4-dihydroxy-2-naphthoate octaprenyltransferase